MAVEDTPNMTNMVFFPLPDSLPDDDAFVAACERKGLLLIMIAPRRVRLVTHLDVNREDVERAAAIITGVLSA